MPRRPTQPMGKANTTQGVRCSAQKLWDLYSQYGTPAPTKQIKTIQIIQTSDNPVQWRDRHTSLLTTFLFFSSLLRPYDTVPGQRLYWQHTEGSQQDVAAVHSVLFNLRLASGTTRCCQSHWAVEWYWMRRVLHVCKLWAKLVAVNMSFASWWCSNGEV